jgi:ribosomal protein L3 glutamine methyltransferase
MKINQKTLDDAIEHLHSIQDFIRWIYSQFEASDLYYGHGTDNSWDEATTLVLQSLNLPFDTPDTILCSRLTGAEKKLITDRVSKRINAKIPVAYLTNQAMFCGSEYYVDERVLVPRSPIAELIEQNFEPWINSSQVDNILDLCTGSGCIAIACSQYFPDAQVDAGDISKDCIDVANKNKNRLGQENVQFYQSDLFNQIPTKQYDIIVSNPPYVDAEDFGDIPDEFLAEPKLGLTSGDDGLDLTRQILKDAPQFLQDDGILVIEVGNSAAALEEAYPTTEFMWIEFERGGHGVFVLTKSQLVDL